MRAFLVLFAVALTQARPDVASNYNYHIPLPHQQLGSSTFQQQTLIGGFGGQENTFALNPHAHGHTTGHTSHSYQHLEEPLISKHFYLHAAPEEHDEGGEKHFTLGRAQKNYRVIFIKAPSSEAAQLSAEYAPNEEKTVIYVLAKKQHELDVNDIATPEPTQPSKPEVFFIKYKTPEEALHAQQKIKDQYEALGGSSQVSDEGEAPVTSVEGSLGSSTPIHVAVSNHQEPKPEILPPNPHYSQYLPPNRF